MVKYNKQENETNNFFNPNVQPSKSHEKFLSSGHFLLKIFFLIFFLLFFAFSPISQNKEKSRHALALTKEIKARFLHLKITKNGQDFIGNRPSRQAGKRVFLVKREKFWS